MATKAVAATLRDVIGLDFEADDIVMTKGASTAIAMVLRTVVWPGDEVIYITPPWFFYEGMIRFNGAVPVKVPMDRETFDPRRRRDRRRDHRRGRGRSSSTPRTTPTGKIYSPGQLAKVLAEVLDAGVGQEQPALFVISDEPYKPHHL